MPISRGPAGPFPVSRYADEVGAPRDPQPPVAQTVLLRELRELREL
jgi:hypothetical protein